MKQVLKIGSSILAIAASVSILSGAFVFSVSAQEGAITPKDIAQGLTHYFTFNDPANPGKNAITDKDNAVAKNGANISTDESQAVSDDMGGVAVFDGTDDYFELPADVFSNLDDGITMSAWVNFQRLADWMRIWDIGTSDRNSFFSLEILWGSKLTGEITNQGQKFNSWQALQGNTNTETDNTTVAANTWVHVAVSSAPDKTAKMYINGTCVQIRAAEGEDLTKMMVCAAGDIHSPTIRLLGKSLFTESDPTAFHDPNFQGKMDDVMIHNRVLSDAEVQFLYTSKTTLPSDVLTTQPSSDSSTDSSGSSNTQSSTTQSTQASLIDRNKLVALYRFDSQTGSKVKDVTGNGYDGTVYYKADGAAWSTKKQASPVLTNGKFGKAMDFSGGYYMDLPSKIVSKLDSSFTISLWLYSKKEQPKFTRILDFGNECDNVAKYSQDGGPWKSVMYLTTSEDKSKNLMFNLWNCSDPKNIFGTEAVIVDQNKKVPTTGTWTNVTYVMDNKELFLFVDGVKVPLKYAGETTVDGRLPDVPANPAQLASIIKQIRVGYGQFDWDGSFSGMMDNIAFFDNALRADDVIEFMNRADQYFITNTPTGESSSPYVMSVSMAAAAITLMLAVFLKSSRKVR